MYNCFGSNGFLHEFYNNCDSTTRYGVNATLYFYVKLDMCVSDKSFKPKEFFLTLFLQLINLTLRRKCLVINVCTRRSARASLLQIRSIVIDFTTYQINATKFVEKYNQICIVATLVKSCVLGCTCSNANDSCTWMCPKRKNREIDPTLLTRKIVLRTFRIRGINK